MITPTIPSPNMADLQGATLAGPGYAMNMPPPQPPISSVAARILTHRSDMAKGRDWRGSSTPVSLSAGARATEQAPLEAVELYTRNVMVLGRVAPEGRRLSDMPNATQITQSDR